MKRNNLEITLNNAIRIGMSGVQSYPEGIRLGDTFYWKNDKGNYERADWDEIQGKPELPNKYYAYTYTPNQMAKQVERFCESIWY